MCVQVAHEVHHGAVSKDAERMSGQLDTFKSEIKHDVCCSLISSLHHAWPRHSQVKFKLGALTTVPKSPVCMLL
jgi:hypothetical protein